MMKRTGVIKMRSSISKSSISNGIGFGSALAISISWSVNKSILWAMLHGVFSWFYVLYYAWQN